MATTLTLETRVYGLIVARCVYGFFSAFGIDHEKCMAAALSCVLMRIKAGKRSRWSWLGSHYG